MHNPEAFYDCLKMVSELEGALLGVSRLEVQRLAFIGCILFLYKGKPAGEWGYKFASTSYSTPFSSEVGGSLDALLQTGRLRMGGERLFITRTGEMLLSSLSMLSSLEERNVYLEAACTSALALPPAAISQGLENEPTIRSSEVRSMGGSLLQGPAAQLLYEHFCALAAVLPPKEGDLVTPSLVWLSYAADMPVSRRVNNG